MIRERNGRWTVEIKMPGQQNRTHIKPADYGFGPLKSLKDAKRLERAALNARDNTTPSTQTCGEFADQWIEIAGRVRDWHPNTVRTHASALRLFKRELGDEPIGGLDEQAAMRWVLKHRHVLGTLRLMFNDAVAWKVIQTNPFSALRLSASAGRKNLVVPSMDDVRSMAALALRVLDPSVAQEFSALLMWTAMTCMRPGEVCAARWSKLDGNRYLVDTQFNSGIGREAGPKHGSAGWIFVPDEALEVVRAKPRRLNDDLMFRTMEGRQFNLESLRFYWDKVRSAWKATLPAAHRLAGRDRPLALAELRHTGASYLLNECGLEAWVVAKQLRHSDGGRLVVTRYGHPDTDEALRRIGEAWGGNRVQDEPSRVEFGVETGREPA